MVFSYRYIFLRDLKLVRGLKKIYGLNLMNIFRIGKILGIAKNNIWKYKFVNSKFLLRIRKLLYKKFFIGARLKKILSLRKNFLRKYRLRRILFFDYGLPAHGQRTKTNSKTCKARGFNPSNLRKQKNNIKLQLKYDRKSVKQKKKYNKKMKKFFQNIKYRNRNRKRKDPWKFKRTFYTRKKAFWVI